MCKEGEGLKQVNTKGWSIKSSDLSSMSLSPKDNAIIDDLLERSLGRKK